MKNRSRAATFFHRRMDDRLHVHAAGEHCSRKHHAGQRIAHDYRDDGRIVAFSGIQAPFSGQFEEQPGIFSQPRHALGLRLQDSYRREGCGGGRSGNADAKDETGGCVFKVFNRAAVPAM